MAQIRYEKITIVAPAVVDRTMAAIGAVAVALQAFSNNKLATVRVLDTDGTTNTNELARMQPRAEDGDYPCLLTTGIYNGKLRLQVQGTGTITVYVSYLDAPPVQPSGRWLALARQQTLAASTSDNITALPWGLASQLTFIANFTHAGGLVIEWGLDGQTLFFDQTVVATMGPDGNGGVTPVLHPFATVIWTNSDVALSNDVTFVIRAQI